MFRLAASEVRVDVVDGNAGVAGHSTDGKSDTGANLKS